MGCVLGHCNLNYYRTLLGRLRNTVCWRSFPQLAKAERFNRDICAHFPVCLGGFVEHNQNARMILSKGRCQSPEMRESIFFTIFSSSGVVAVSVIIFVWETGRSSMEV